ncbi:MAG: hypothetical protein ACJ8AT_23600 [Hyalangium sp.]|uniref:hypothetical protein n=1 Tax=Hyalangium sp. TaxID=2028555 RepID=UPI003899DFFE
MEGTPQDWPWQRLLLIGILLVALLLVLITWGALSERRAVERMAPQERALLFQQTWKGFELLCQGQADPGLVSRCGDQARFLKEFPECQEDCRQQVDSFSNRASR